MLIKKAKTMVARNVVLMRIQHDTVHMILLFACVVLDSCTGE